MINLLQQLIDLVFPRACFCCGDRLLPFKPYKAETSQKEYLWEISKYLCPVCIENIVILSEDICPKCGNPLKATGCPHCANTQFKFTAARSVFLFDDHIRRLVHGLKYYDFMKIAPVLSAYAALYLEKHWQWEKPDIILPVPLHKVRQRERGFNQSAVLGKWLADFSGIEYDGEVLTRNRYTQTQTALNRKERHKNVMGAFSLNHPEKLTGKRVLILDDVFTSGSTCNSIAKLLSDNGLTQVFVLTIARPS